MYCANCKKEFGDDRDFKLFCLVENSMAEIEKEMKYQGFWVPYRVSNHLMDLYLECCNNPQFYWNSPKKEE